MFDIFKIFFDVGFVILTWVSILFIVVAIYRLLSSPDVDKIKKEYEERIKNLKDQVKELQDTIKLREQQHKEELKSYLRSSKMVIGLKNALDHGVVKVKCPIHDEDVEILADGTIICRKGHRIWPREEEKIPNIPIVEEEEG